MKTTQLGVLGLIAAALAAPLVLPLGCTKSSSTPSEDDATASDATSDSTSAQEDTESASGSQADSSALGDDDDDDDDASTTPSHSDETSITDASNSESEDSASSDTPSGTSSDEETESDDESAEETGSDTGDDTTDDGNACDDFESIVSKATFDKIFPLNLRNPAYTYEGMVEATKSYPEFATTGDCDTRKREIAAIFANITREVGCLQYIEQIDLSTGPYCDQGQPYGCPAGEDAYFGRGPIQLSWNYNYYAAGEALGLDLLTMPQIVAEDAKVAWQTGLWFWNTAGGGDRNPHSAITSGEGFGTTIDMINGYEECNGGTVGYASEAVTVRVCAYQAYTALLGTDVGPGDLNCGTELQQCPPGCLDQ